ncbi:MAG: AMP-binding protein [Bacteroidetes bacterium]|nr:AMP-binding protein [Bacteroidota bacterium]
MALFQPDWASRWALYQPEKMAVKEHETQRSLTYGDLNEQGNALAFHFQYTWKLEKGSRVAIISEFCLEYIVLFIAAQKTGVILVPLNYRLTSQELNYMLNDADPTVIIFQEKFASLIQQSQHFSQIPQNITIESIPDVWEETQENHEELFEKVALEEKDPIFILYTSGTTGSPKGALYTHGMLFWNSINTSMSLLINSESRTVNCMPPFHTGGWNVLLTPLLHHGGYTCLLKKFDSEEVLELLEAEKPTLFMGVPTMLNMISKEHAFLHADFSSLYYIIVGGEPMPIPLIELWHQKGIAIRQGYGMTEVGPNLTSLHQKDAIRKKGSIGFPNFYLQTKIVNENGKEAETGEAGELLLKGPMVTPGYWKNPKETEAAFSDGWFHTGDQVRKDEEGYYYIVDRIKNMYISGGENVYPAEVEKVILSHPEIREVVVIGVPDPKWGESGRAYIVKKEGELNASTVIDFCKKRLAKYKVPKEVIFIDELPQNGTGKIDRKGLKAGALAGGV